MPVRQMESLRGSVRPTRQHDSLHGLPSHPSRMPLLVDRRELSQMCDVPTKDELRAFLHKQIAECRQHRPEDVDGLLEKLHDIDGTHSFVEQVLG
jgi:hypothetical protein